MNWEQREKIWDEARAKANVDAYITAAGNPLRRLIEPRTPPYERNMAVLEQDYQARSNPIQGKIYAGLMDNMRYGGSD